MPPFFHKKYLLLLFFAHMVVMLSAQTPGQSTDQTLITNFKLSPDGADILLEWEIKDETNVSEFQLYRKINNEPTLTFVSSVLVSGVLKYKYLDDDIFKQSGRIIQYELHVIKNNQVIKFVSIPLAHTPTSIQRTWGSIKSLFR